MKYANISMQRSGLNNLGDNMQLIAINNLYSHMGIEEKEIVRIDYYDLSSYDGDYVILPINYPFYGYRNDLDITMFSPKIIPVFLGISIMSVDLSEDEKNYFRRFEPIGCRDEYTMNQLRKAGIMAYLNGCVTATLPRKRTGRFEGGKVIFVDVSSDFKKYVPLEILQRSEFITQMAYDPSSAEELMNEYYLKYINEASFVVTTRLHCAVPCMAAGIPVILIKDTYSFRFPWLNKLLTIYTKDDYQNIDWNPKSINYETLKSKIILNDCNTIKDSFKKFDSKFDISMIFEDKELTDKGEVEHADSTIRYINENWDKNITIDFAFWGITQPASLIYKYILKYYPNANLKYVFDKNKKVQFCDRTAIDIHEIDLSKETELFVFVTTASAYTIAEDYFKEIDKTNYYQCSGDNILKR